MDIITLFMVCTLPLLAASLTSSIILWNVVSGIQKKIDALEARGHDHDPPPLTKAKKDRRLVPTARAKRSA